MYQESCGKQDFHLSSEVIYHVRIRGFERVPGTHASLFPAIKNQLGFLETLALLGLSISSGSEKLTPAAQKTADEAGNLAPWGVPLTLGGIFLPATVACTPLQPVCIVWESCLAVMGDPPNRPSAGLL